MQVGGADGGSGEAGAAVFALDDPAAAEGVGGFHVCPVVSGAADLDGVLAAVAEHQVAYRVLELAVVQPVQTLQRIPQPLHLGLPLPLLCTEPEPEEGAGTGPGRQQGDGQDPGMGGGAARWCGGGS